MKMVRFDAGRAAQVETILANARGRMSLARQQLGAPADEETRAALRYATRAIREETDLQLSAVLTAEELAKLKEAMPKLPPRRGDGSPKRSAPM